MRTKKKQTFEASLKKLEKIVGQLEDGDLSLEESLKLFEDGVKLSRECRDRLDQAERRIEILLKDNEGDPKIEGLETEGLQEKEKKTKRRIVFENDEDDETPF